METIAIYWEPIIKTYGIEVRTGLTLATIPLTTDTTDPRFLHYLETAETHDNVIIIFAPSFTDGVLRLSLLFDGTPPPDTDGSTPAWIEVEKPVELLYFHGPHYGDRYGITDAALSALADAKVPLRAMACSGASVYIVVPEGFARKAGKALSQAFVVPSTKNGSDS